MALTINNAYFLLRLKLQAFRDRRFSLMDIGEQNWFESLGVGPFPTHVVWAVADEQSSIVGLVQRTSRRPAAVGLSRECLDLTQLARAGQDICVTLAITDRRKHGQRRRRRAANLAKVTRGPDIAGVEILDTSAADRCGDENGREPVHR